MPLVPPGERHYQTKQELVYHTLRSAIMRCDLVPGARLVIEDIAQQLQVSPIPVREALQLLQSERLVENKPHVGAMVAAISQDSIIEIFALIEGLESVATRMATERLTREHEVMLESLLADMDVAAQANDYERWSDLNTRFHRYIAAITEMPKLQEMTGLVLDHWDRIRRYFRSDNSSLSQRMAQAQQEHHAIVRAMRAGDEAQLEQLVKRHNREALAAYTRGREQSA